MKQMRKTTAPAPFNYQHSLIKLYWLQLVKWEMAKEREKEHGRDRPGDGKRWKNNKPIPSFFQFEICVAIIRSSKYSNDAHLM